MKKYKKRDQFKEEKWKYPFSIVPIFATPVAGYQLDHKQYNKHLDKVVDKTPVSEYPAVHGGVTAYDPKIAKEHRENMHILGDKALEPLLGEIQDCVDHYMEKVGFKPAAIVSSWFNILEKDGYVDAHRHKHSYLSGCYYHTCPEGSSPFQLHDPKAGILNMNKNKPTAKLKRGKEERIVDVEGYWHREKFTAYTYEWTDVPVNSGLLFLFPSYLGHRVKPCKDLKEGEQRINFSFNCIAKEHLEDYTKWAKKHFYDKELDHTKCDERNQ